MQWGEEQAKAFEALKTFIENPAIMSSPSEKAELLLYIATSGAAVSAALVEERLIEGELKQVPIYLNRRLRRLAAGLPLRRLADYSRYLTGYSRF